MSSLAPVFSLGEEARRRAAPSRSVSFSAEIGGIRVHFGVGVLDLLGPLARELGGRRILVVTDPGVRAAGHAGRALAFLEREGLEAALFDQAEEDPTSLTVEAGRAFAAAFGPDLLVAVGGGSALDTAKGINFVHTNGGRMEDYWGTGKAAQPMLPSIGVPTTAGTGSEAQSYALITHPETRQKMACGDRKARFGAVLLDPELLASAPRRTATAAGIDAVSHAVESYVTKRGNPVSRMLAREAWRLLDGSLPAHLASPGDLGAAGDALLGAHLAGAAIEASMLGAAHSCANPLSARYGLTHGVAVGLMLPPVIRFNAAVAGDLYAELDRRLPERIEELRALSGLPARLRDVGVEEHHLPELAEEAARQWTAQFNPRPVTAADLLGLYREAYGGAR
ncbi:MAG TPA: iron-containing alcohol dehydrogenase [Thermoanaerobaculia bacterium]|jgi:alcohol dehydrogenase